MKKRTRQGQAPRGRERNPISGDLRKISHAIGKGRHSEGLSDANRLLGNRRMGQVNRGRLLSQIADSEFKRGRFDQAASIHLQAASSSLEDARLWLRPYIGQIRALLKVPDVNQAVIMARHALTIAKYKMAEFDRQVKQANRRMGEGQQVVVPDRPIRISVVAARLADLFMKEGEPEAAEEFFNEALETNPRGANKARQGLARIALSKGDYTKAADTAMDAIRRGGHGKKTMEAWKTLIAARRGAGRWRISENLIKGLEEAPPSVRARTILLITSELRKNDMRQWREVAEHWLEEEGEAFPIVATDIKKMKLSSARTAIGQLELQQTLSADLLQTPDLARGEWLSAAKEWLRTSLLKQENADIAALLASAEELYTDAYLPTARHGLALACMMAKRHDLARPLLQENIQTIPINQPQWGKSVWALARMEALLGNPAAAADLYGEFAETTSIAPRFRLQAKLLWCENLLASGNIDAIDQAYADITVILSSVTDPDVLMNFARQLRFAPSGILRERAQDLFEQGKAMAQDRFNQEINPSSAIQILFKLTRRQVCDFGDTAAVTQFWESMEEDKIDWLWSEQSRFWEYLGYVFDAYIRQGRFAQAEHFALGWLDDPATPFPVAGPPLGTRYARRLIRNGRVEEGLDWCNRLVKVAPAHPLCAAAWYWLALAAHASGDMELTAEHARRIRKAQGTHGNLLSEWELDAKALLLLAGLEPSHISPNDAVNYSGGFLQKQLQGIQSDLGRMAP